MVSTVVERTKAVLQDGGKGRDDYSVLVSVLLGGALPELCLAVLFEVAVRCVLIGWLDWIRTDPLASPCPCAKCMLTLGRKCVCAPNNFLFFFSSFYCRLVLQVKWLSFLGAVLIELSGREASIPRASSIAKELCPLLLEGLDHPFKACREEIAR